jgi:hypothetical protein
MIGYLCDRCARPTDICPCTNTEAARLEVQRRHRASVRLARANGWAGDARRRNDPVGVRRWAA